MTTEELIRLLLACDPAAEVYLAARAGGNVYLPARDVEAQVCVAGADKVFITATPRKGDA